MKTWMTQSVVAVLLSFLSGVLLGCSPPKASQGVTGTNLNSSWTVVAFVSATDKETHQLIYSALKKQNIECTWAGSVIHGLYVPNSNATQAVRLLEQTQSFKDKRVRFAP